MLNVVNEFEENFGADNDLEYRGDLKWQGWLAKMGTWISFDFVQLRMVDWSTNAFKAYSYVIPGVQ